MLQYLKNENNLTFTENGAVTNRSSGDFNLDLFATIGAIRHLNEKDILDRFIRAFMEDKDIALKILFYGRDVRGGLGERRVFRIILNWLASNYPESAKKNLAYVAEFGRYDDLMCLFGTPCEEAAMSLIKEQLNKDLANMAEGKEVTLLAKWLPSINTSNSEAVSNAKKIARYLNMNGAEYRKTLSSLRAYIKILENNLREKDYTFDYEKQPSNAMYKYKKAFIRNDGERYHDYLDSVSKGEKKMNTGNVAPYQLVAPYLNYYGITNLSEEEKLAINTTWDNLPDYGGDEDILAVIDGSGSMYSSWTQPSPASVALSLGLYFAERNKGAFRNHFITFSHAPRLVELKGEAFLDKLKYAMTFNEVANTNIEAVFQLILDTAVKNNLSSNELPSKIVIISDMEFDYCTQNADMTNFQNAKRMFEEKGYKLPDLVFWNVNSRNEQQPVTKNDRGVALVSGCTPRLFSMIAGGIIDPYQFMMDVLNAPRYSVITS